MHILKTFSPDYKEYVRQKNAKRYALEKQMMLEDSEYAAQIREKRRKAKAESRQKQKEKENSPLPSKPKPTGRGDR